MLVGMAVDSPVPVSHIHAVFAYANHCHRSNHWTGSDVVRLSPRCLVKSLWAPLHDARPQWNRYWIQFSVLTLPLGRLMWAPAASFYISLPFWLRTFMDCFQRKNSPKSIVYLFKEEIRLSSLGRFSDLRFPFNCYHIGNETKLHRFYRKQKPIRTHITCTFLYIPDVQITINSPRESLMWILWAYLIDTNYLLITIFNANDIIAKHLNTFRWSKNYKRKKQHRTIDFSARYTLTILSLFMQAASEKSTDRRKNRYKRCVLFMQWVLNTQ